MADTTQATLWQRVRAERRRRIHRFGRRLVKRLGKTMARQSLVGDPAVFDTSVLPWTARLEASWRPIRAELDRLLEYREHIPPFQEISPDQTRIATDTRWRTFIFYGFGHKAPKSCASCPVTTRLLESIPNLHSAWFSILAPGYHIPSHRGVTKGIIRTHLGLKVPAAAERCRMTIGDTSFHWQEGRCVVFDDTYRHEVLNDTPEERVVLIIDVDRPMRLWGRIISKTFLHALRLTAYFKDAKRNMRQWETKEERFLAAVQRAEEIHVP
jgi:beta-hydroxylase